MKMFIRSVLAVGVLALAAGSANAAVIDFSTGNGGVGGILNISATNVTGTGILIDTVTIAGATLNGVFNVNGSGTCADVLGGCGMLSFDRNANTISLVGSIPGLGINSPIALLTGDLSGGVIVGMNDGATGGVTLVGHDTKNPDLLSAIGLDPGTQFNLFGGVIGFSNTGAGPYTADSTDIHNNSGSGTASGQTLVPEPGSLLLFGTGLFGAATKLRRRFSQKA
jgi:hypothetical protein